MSPEPAASPPIAEDIAELRLADGVRLLQRRCGSAPQRRAQRGTGGPARVITMAWGDRYIADLLEIAIPALLAPGNLPAFAAEFDCEFVIVTETRLFDRVARSTAIAVLLQFADLRLVPIDDLLSQWYGMTLTYALVRGFADLGEAMTRTHLVFLNADFIVADGSYGRLAEAIKRGERLVCAPSYCMNLEATADLLVRRRDAGGGALALPPRELAAIVIANRHNTIRAKTVNQRLFRIHRYDQFYWHVDEHTLLARQMPIAVVYMRPERVLRELCTFWDYGVISEYCPTATPCVLGDSDDFLMAELRSDGAFRDLLRLGWPSIAEIAADLSSFTTKDHRDYGRFPLVLHARDVPPAAAAAGTELGAFVDDVYARLRPPIGYRHHPFWAPQFPQFLAHHQAADRQRRAAAAARATLVRGEPTAALREERLLALGGRLVAGAKAVRLAEQRLYEARQQVQERLGQLDDAYRQAQGALQAELRPDRAAAEDRLRWRRDELAALADAAAELERHQEEAVQSWRRREAAGPPPEAACPAAGSSGAGAWRNRFLEWCGGTYRRLFGTIVAPRRWHPYYTLLHPAMMAVAAADGARILVVSSDGVVGSAVMRAHRGERLTITPDMAGSDYHRDELNRGDKFGFCLCDLALNDLVRFRTILEQIRPVLAAPARIVVFHGNLGGRPLDAWTDEFARGLFPLIGRSSIAFTGSLPGAVGLRWFAGSLQRLNTSRPSSVVRLALTLIFCAPLARLAAAIEPRRPPTRLPKYCTSLRIVIDLP